MSTALLRDILQICIIYGIMDAIRGEIMTSSIGGYPETIVENDIDFFIKEEEEVSSSWLAQVIKFFTFSSADDTSLNDYKVTVMDDANENEAICGFVGKGEMFRRVRVTWINGIDYTFEDTERIAGYISRVFGGVNVHYLYNPSTGFLKDFYEGMKQYFHDDKKPLDGDKAIIVQQLVNYFRRMIADLGGINGGGRIVHLAHSQGGMITQLASQLLTQEERDMIDVVTFASVKIVSAKDYGSVINYMSNKDPAGHVNSGISLWRSNQSTDEIIYLDPIPYNGYIDHSMQNPTYKSALMAVGQKFRVEYETPFTKMRNAIINRWKDFRGQEREDILL